MAKGERIKLRREALGYSQTELAERVKISKQTLYKYENNIITNIPSDIIEELASALDCSPSYLMGWDENQNDDFPENIRSAARDIMSLSDYEQALAIEMIKTIAKKGKEAKQD